MHAKRVAFKGGRVAFRAGGGGAQGVRGFWASEDDYWVGFFFWGRGGAVSGHSNNNNNNNNNKSSQ